LPTLFLIGERFFDSSPTVLPPHATDATKTRTAADIQAPQLPSGVTVAAPSEAPVSGAPVVVPAEPIKDDKPLASLAAELRNVAGDELPVDADAFLNQLAQADDNRVIALQTAYDLAGRYQNTSGEAREEAGLLAIEAARALTTANATGFDINAGHSRILADAAFIAMRDPQFDRAEVIGWLDLAASAGDRVSDALLTEIESRRVYARGQLAAQQRGGPQPPPQ